MAETLEAPTIPEAATADRALPRQPVPWTLRAYVREHPALSTAVVIAVLSTVLVVWARTRPSYDAYGWLLWGHQALHLNLDLGGAPSWKPLPFLFTVPLAVAGHYELWLWMITAVSISLAGAVFAGRIAYKLISGTPAGTGGAIALDATRPVALDPTRSVALDPTRRNAAITAGAFAGLVVLGLEDYMHYILSAQSDPMIVTFVLAAIDCHLSGRHRWAFALAVFASLGRPEAWPFCGLYGIWCWWRFPKMRWMVYAGAALVAFMWFGIPTITNHRPLVAGQLAKLSPRALHQNKIVGTIDRFTELHYLPVWLAALLTVIVAGLRRNWLILALAGGCVFWVIVEIAFALHGWPALPRYMFEPAAVAAALAGVAVGWIVLEAPRAWHRVPRWAGAVVAALLVASLIPGAVSRARTERRDLRHEHARTHQIALLQSVTNRLGGSRHIRNCGQPVTDVAYVSALAWLFHTNVGSVGGLQQHVEAAELRRPIPKVLFTPLSQGGWKVVPWHTRASQVHRCAGLRSIYTNSGRLIHQHPRR